MFSWNGNKAAKVFALMLLGAACEHIGVWWLIFPIAMILAVTLNYRADGGAL